MRQKQEKLTQLRLEFNAPVTPDPSLADVASQRDEENNTLCTEGTNTMDDNLLAHDISFCRPGRLNSSTKKRTTTTVELHKVYEPVCFGVY